MRVFPRSIPQTCKLPCGCLLTPSSGAANRFPEKCDADSEGTRSLNINASRRLAQATSTRSILLIYISTDYVFPGNPGDAPYEADATPDPPNFYGQTKYDGEKAVLEENSEKNLGIVLRVPVLYGSAEEPSESTINVLMDVVWKAQTKDSKIIMDDWAQKYPTNTEDIARVLFDVASKYWTMGEARSELPRILQFSSEEKFTKFEICQLFAEIMGLPIGGIHGNKEAGNPEATVKRPYDTHLSSQTIKDLDINVQTQDFQSWWLVVSIPYNQI